MASRTGVAAGDPGSPSARAAAGEEDAKVKLLCSYAGRIAPRAGDGALRYVGGHTRLISLPRAASFADLMRKVEAVDESASASPSAASGTLLKYQLPGEDLDALVSVSCDEDYGNMLEEYDKLAPDGSAKLRVFLFPPAGSDPSPAAPAAVDEHGQRYIDAINSVSADALAAAAAIRRKESGASAASSAHNSEASDLAEAGSHNAFPQSLGFTSAVTAPAVGIPAQNPVLVRTEPSPLQPHQVASYAPSHHHQPAQIASYVQHHQPTQVASYAPQVASYAPPQQPQVASYAPPQQLPQVASYTQQMPQSHTEPQQVQYINAQQFGQHGASQPVNLMPVQVSQQYVASTLATNSMATAATQIGTPSTRPVYAGTEHVLENLHFTRPMQTPVDPNYRVLQQPLSQLPPLSHMALQTSDAQRHGGVQTVVTSAVSSPVSTSSGTFPVVVSSATVPPVRYDDCTMCQKVLPHAHSDSMIQDQGNPRAAAYPDAAPVFYSLHQQNVTSQYAPGASASTPANYTAEPRAEAGMTQYGQTLSARNPAVQATSSPTAGGMVQPTMVTVPVSSALTSNGVFVGHPPYSRAEDHFTYQHPQQQIYSMQPSQVLANGFVSNPHRVDATAFKNSNQPVADPLREYVHGVPHEYSGAIDARMEGVNLGHIAPQESTVQGNSAIPHGAVGYGKIGNPPATMDGASVYKSQAEGYHLGINNAFPIPSFIPEDNLVIHTEQPPPPLNVAAQNVHPEIIQRPNMLPSAPVSSNLVVTIGQPVSSETLLVRPAYSGFQAPAGPPPPLPVEILNHMVSAPHPVSSQVVLQSTAGTDRVEATCEPAYTESLFSNQDPWKALGNASVVPPRPNNLVNGPIVSGYPYVEGHVPAITSSNAVTLLEEGNLSHIHQDPTFKDIYPEPAQISKGYGEESIKCQLQAVAEGVAASVLQSSFPEKPTKTSGDHIDSHGAVVDPKIEDAPNKGSDKTSQGVPVLDDIDNLQIIKNIDLEELRELGSGTFGTVYHGKWRGSDVAIKRISDRCFSGKASEGQKMKTDFWNEACKLASLHHPNVVAFYGVVLDGPGGSVATVTEYMANGSLRQALQRHEKIFDRRRRLLIVMDIAFGMEYLHGKNIVHFDLKSDNLLVNLRDSQRPICKVGDLGLSKVKCQTLISGGVRGTLPWMAPELLNGSSNLVSEKVDVFSFGIVMWELITGEEPYADLHYGAIIGGIVNNTLRPPVPESCDPQWSSLMEQCWSAEPLERPSFTEIVKRLRAMATSPTKAQPQK